jgi:hypothetical protein
MRPHAAHRQESNLHGTPSSAVSTAAVISKQTGKANAPRASFRQAVQKQTLGIARPPISQQYDAIVANSPFCKLPAAPSG